MIKQAAPQHPQGLTKLQHRLLYESDSDSSFDLTFSSPSSIGSASEYSDVGYHSSSRSRTSSYGRRVPAHGHASRSESISSVLGSSLAIQRVLMGNNTSPAALKKSHRQSVRDIAAAFEQNNKTSAASAPKKLGSQLGRVDEKREIDTVSQAVQNPRQQTLSGGHGRTATGSSMRSHTATLSSQSNDSHISRVVSARGTIPPRLNITKQPVKGPLSAPPVITPGSASQSGSMDSSPAETQFVFPPRNASQVRSPARVRTPDGRDGQKDDEPIFDIIPSPSRTRNVPLPISTYPAQRPAIFQRNSSRIDSGSSGLCSPPMPSSLSTVSRNSMDSTFSNDSLSGHPFSLQLPSDDLRTSSAASLIDLDEIEAFRSPFIGFINPLETAQLDHKQQQQVEVLPVHPAVPVQEAVAANRASTSNLQPLLLSTSRPSSSGSTATLTPSTVAPVAPSSMRVNDDTAFPLPPSTMSNATRSRSNSPRSRPLLLKSDRLTTSPQKDTFKPAPTPNRALDLGSESGADQSLAVDELKREAAALLASIRDLGDEIDSSIPPTHRLPGSYRKTPSSNKSGRNSAEEDAKASFVAVDTTYSQVWGLMDSWYWSSFELGPKQSF